MTMWMKRNHCYSLTVSAGQESGQGSPGTSAQVSATCVALRSQGPPKLSWHVVEFRPLWLSRWLGLLSALRGHWQVLGTWHLTEQSLLLQTGRRIFFYTICLWGSLIASHTQESDQSKSHNPLKGGPASHLNIFCWLETRQRFYPHSGGGDYPGLDSLQGQGFSWRCICYRGVPNLPEDST